MALGKLSHTIFYRLEKSMKNYRQFAQRNIKEAGSDITIDQWLVLKTLYDQPEITQQQLAKMVFKDYASITRIIELLVQRKYIARNPHPGDRRRFKLSITPTGGAVIDTVAPIVTNNRATALNGISKSEMEQLNHILEKIMANCQQSPASVNYL